jgi:hypothetical protein
LENQYLFFLSCSISKAIFSSFYIFSEYISNSLHVYLFWTLFTLVHPLNNLERFASGAWTIPADVLYLTAYASLQYNSQYWNYLWTTQIYMKW